MHLAFLTPEYPHAASTTSGGLGTSIKNLTQELVLKGVEVSIIIYGQKRNQTFTEGNIHFYLVKQKNYKFGGWYFYRKFLQNFLNRLAEKEKIDLIEAADWTGITAFMNIKKPLVLRLHGSDTYFCTLEGRKQKWKNRWFERNALKNADRIISVSEFAGKKTMQLFGINTGFKVIPNAVNLKKFTAEDENIDPDQLLYFGSLLRKKGVLELASIFNSVVEKRPSTTLTVLGKDVKDARENTSTLELYRNLLSAKAIKNFTYLGEMQYEQVKFQLAKAAVIVLPSFAEAFPMTWLEAMAMGKALVTSNIGWAPEIMINGKTGFTEHPEDHDNYATKILKLLGNPDLRREMGVNARKKVCHEFSSEIIASKNISFYESVLKQTDN
ncbi:glycosyltransferase family 4 protein [Zunongwangia sp. F363]|uniref:Glycosyltransferase family 4 protein n=1 Tax=Autumnicola tepida TaxID=3075595 RepID=A0ABU3C9Z7_9FLAO|nr:glycosyltransferase family 4 protein [Zunongwangia sp. F363]MDT0643032.1 glycosyltransferase family 4 protein [Zunongwangia sp. F363]